MMKDSLAIIGSLALMKDSLALFICMDKYKSSARQLGSKTYILQLQLGCQKRQIYLFENCKSHKYHAFKISKSYNFLKTYSNNIIFFNYIQNLLKNNKTYFSKNQKLTFKTSGKVMSVQDEFMVFFSAQHFLPTDVSY